MLLDFEIIVVEALAFLKRIVKIASFVEEYNVGVIGYTVGLPTVIQVTVGEAI